MDDAPRLRPLFQPGENVSTMRQVGQRRDGRPIWDLCCAGPIERVDERGGAFFYTIASSEPHLHPEGEVCPGGTASYEIDQLNNKP